MTFTIYELTMLERFCLGLEKKAIEITILWFAKHAPHNLELVLLTAYIHELMNMKDDWLYLYRATIKEYVEGSWNNNVTHSMGQPVRNQLRTPKIMLNQMLFTDNKWLQPNLIGAHYSLSQESLRSSLIPSPITTLTKLSLPSHSALTANITTKGGFHSTPYATLNNSYRS